MTCRTLLVCAASCAFLACGSDDGGGNGPDGNEDIPAIAYCDPVSGWDAPWIDLENQVLAIVNQRRSEGADCGSEGSFGSAGPLESDGALHCAARVHSKDMADRGFWGHTNPDNETPWDRMERAGYNWSRAAENIARGSTTADAVMAGWMNSDEHCANIMNPDLVNIGIGYHATGNHWTQVFGSPR